MSTSQAIQHHSNNNEKQLDITLFNLFTIISNATLSWRTKCSEIDDAIKRHGRGLLKEKYGDLDLLEWAIQHNQIKTIIHLVSQGAEIKNLQLAAPIINKRVNDKNKNEIEETIAIVKNLQRMDEELQKVPLQPGPIRTFLQEIGKEDLNILNATLKNICKEDQQKKEKIIDELASKLVLSDVNARLLKGKTWVKNEGEQSKENKKKYKKTQVVGYGKKVNKEKADEKENSSFFKKIFSKIKKFFFPTSPEKINNYVSIREYKDNYEEYHEPQEIKIANESIEQKALLTQQLATIITKFNAASELSTIVEINQVYNAEKFNLGTVSEIQKCVINLNEHLKNIETFINAEKLEYVSFVEKMIGEVMTAEFEDKLGLLASYMEKNPAFYYENTAKFFKCYVEYKLAHSNTTTIENLDKFLPLLPTVRINRDSDLIDPENKKIKKLGDGNQGVVYSIKESNTDLLDAYKVVLGDFNTIDHIRALQKEAKIMEKFKDSPYILQAKGIDEGFEMVTRGGVLKLQRRTGAVAEVASKGNLSKFILGNKEKLSFSMIVGLILDAVKGLEFMHNAGVVHFDFKPDNIFISEKSGLYCGKIGDFGAVENVGKILPGGRGTAHYAAPELKSNEYAWRIGEVISDSACDVYSLGKTILEVIQKWQEKEGKELTNKNPVIEKQEDNLKSLKKLAEQCCNENSKDRPTASEVVKKLAPILEDIKKIEEKYNMELRIKEVLRTDENLLD